MIPKQIEEIKPKDYCIMSQKLAAILMSNGYPLRRIAPNKKYPNKNVFYFYYNDEIDNFVREYKKNKNCFLELR